MSVSSDRRDCARALQNSQERGVDTGVLIPRLYVTAEFLATVTILHIRLVARGTAFNRCGHSSLE